MRKIAVTGGLATGKSTVCHILEECGAYVVSADTIVGQLLSQEGITRRQVVELLGPEIITNHQIDKKKVSNIVFSNPSKLSALESILHPAVQREINRLFENVKNNKAYRLFVAEVPLLYEAHMEKDFDAVIAVITDESTAKARSGNPEEFERRSRFQFPQAAKQLDATFVIKNQGILSSLKAQVSDLIPQLLLL